MGLLGLLAVWLVVGLVVGAVARLLVPGPDPMGCLGTAGLGIAGSFVGGTLANLLAGRGFEISPAVIGSVLGAVLLLLLLRGRR